MTHSEWLNVIVRNGTWGSWLPAQFFIAPQGETYSSVYCSGDFILYKEIYFRTIQWDLWKDQYLYKNKLRSPGNSVVNIFFLKKMKLVSNSISPNFFQMFLSSKNAFYSQIICLRIHCCYTYGVVLNTFFLHKK